MAITQVTAHMTAYRPILQRYDRSIQVVTLVTATVMECYVMSYSLTLLDLMLPLFAQFLGNKIITYRFVAINVRSILSVRSTIAKLTGRCG